MGTPTEDEFRALSRSSPWLFRTLHFTRRNSRHGEVEAWLARPGRLLVVDAEARRHAHSGPPYTKHLMSLDDGPDPVWMYSPPQDHDPVRRPDGLVAERPDGLDIDYDDPLWGSYDWVAMLDPRELATGTVITDLAETTRHGRTTWWASVVAVEGYDPRCSCCPLLWGEASERIDAEAGSRPPPTEPRPPYPDAWLVGLDRQTGIVVSLEAIGGTRRDVDFTVDIHEVDALMDDDLFARTEIRRSGPRPPGEPTRPRRGRRPASGP